jgi:tetratricopeptide (TPR) repeat protein
MRLRRRLRTLALLAGLAAAASACPGVAQAQETNSANVDAARRHFERARTDYAQGSYREAIGELEAAHTLDPSAKDLVFNLGVVHEKLSDIDDALQWFQLYTTMSLTAQERERADAYIRRLEGAKKELAQRPAGRPATPAPPPPTDTLPSSLVLSASVPPPGNAAHGRVDAATITALSVTGAALAFGTVMAIKAAADKPPSGFVTGVNGSYSDLASATSSAHREALFADVGFGVSLAAGITAAVLYFARAPGGASSSPPAGSGSPSVSAAPLAGGAALLVQGSL